MYRAIRLHAVITGGINLSGVMMKKCQCGSEDWKEIGSTWLCMACSGKEYENAMMDLKKGLERMQRAEQVMRGMKLDTMSIRDSIDNLNKEIENLSK